MESEKKRVKVTRRYGITMALLNETLDVMQREGYEIQFVMPVGEDDYVRGTGDYFIVYKE